MSGLPENDPLLHDPVAHEEDVARKERELLATIDKHFPYSVPEFEAPQDPLHPPEPPLFHSWAEREMFAPERRTPNMVDVGLLAILVVFGFRHIAGDRNHVLSALEVDCPGNVAALGRA